MITIIATIFVFGVIVLIHEWGHFITAKLTGMRVDEFAIGFGSALWSRRKGETLYSLRAVPLGGYNKIAGMTEEEANEENVPRDRAFVYKPLWARFVVIAAGATMNFVLAILLFIGVFAFRGIDTINEEPVIGRLLPNTPAAVSMLRPGDRIVEIQGTKINKWTDISPRMQELGGQTVNVTVSRNGELHRIELVPKIDNNRVMLGITPEIMTREVGIGESIVLGTDRALLMLKQMLIGLGMLVTGNAPAADLAGPVGIAQMAGTVARTGIWNLLIFTGILSLNLGLINLLPVPVLDGGHLVLILLEALRGKKLPDKALYYIQMVGIAMLATVFLWATGNDILRFLK